MFGVKYGSGSFAGISVVKRAPASAGDSFHPRLRRSPWRRKWLLTLVFFPGKSHEQRSLAGYSPRRPKESDTTE